MKRTPALLIFLAVCTIPLLASLPVQWLAQQAANPTVASGGGGSADVTENFETPTTGYENSWTTVTGTPNPVQSTSGLSLEGSQCLSVPSESAACQLYTAFSASDKAYAFFELRFSTLPGGGDTTQFGFGNGTDIMIAASQGGVGEFKLYSAGEDAFASGSAANATGTTYYIWLEYEKGTGANGVFRLYRSTDTTKPGSPDAAITTSNDTIQVSRFYLGNDWSGNAGNFYIDKLRISRTTAFGSNPS